MNELARGVKVDGYRLEQLLGSGAFGAVWSAVHEPSGDRVALKFLTDLTRNAHQRFEREAELLGRLRHPHIVRVRGTGDWSSSRYIAMELLDGEPLDRWLSVPRSFYERAQIGIQVCDALSYAHRHGVVHRDLKPANVIVTKGPEGWHAFVVDLGVAKVFDDLQGDVTETGDVIGTAGYMSPEQLRGQRDIRPPADVYALGALLYVMFEERSPFPGDTMLEVAMRQLREGPAPPRADIPPDVSDIIVRCMAMAPTDRPRLPHVSATLASHVRTARPIGLLVLAVVGVIGAVALVVSIAGRSADDIVIVPQHRSVSGLVKSDDPDDAGPPQHAEAEEHEPASEPAIPQHVCPGAPQVGTFDLKLASRWSLDPPQSVLVHVPESYDPTRPAPTLVLFHPQSQQAHEFLDRTGIVTGAEKRGFVVIAPGGMTRPFKAWETSQRLLAYEQIDRVIEHLCLDRDQIFTYGHIAGGYAVHRARCNGLPVAAEVSSGFRWSDTQTACATRPAPALMISHLHEPTEPAAGGTGCLDSFGGNASRSIDAHEQLSAGVRGCRGPGPAAQVEHGTCREWSCGVRLRTCRVNGGQRWPGRTEVFNCEGEPSKFDYVSEMWSFIDSVRAGSARPKAD